MRARILTEIVLLKKTLHPGEIIEVSESLLTKLGGWVEPLSMIGTNGTAELWREFTLEADRVYRKSPKTPDTWGQHMKHRYAAVARCRDGDIAAARVELQLALEALQGVSLTQQNLI